MRGIVGIEESSWYAAKMLEALDREYDHITFIGHSMGGLIGRYLIQKTPHWQHIDSYISLATPHQGSPLSFLAPWSESARQMKTHSAFLKDLNEAGWPQHIPALTISGGWDPLVPQYSTHFWAEDDHIRMARTSHMGLLLHPRVFLELWGWLTYKVFEEVGFEEPLGYESKINFA